MTLKQHIFLMKAEIGGGNMRLACCQHYPGNGVHKDSGKLIWNKSSKFLPLSLHMNLTRSRMTLVLLPQSIDDELDEGKC